MKFWSTIFALIIGTALAAQAPLLPIIDSCQEFVDTTPIVLQFDTIPPFTYFDASDVSQHISRIASLNKVYIPQSKYFLVLLIISIVFTFLYLNSKETVTSSFSSLFNIHFALQYFRTDKQTNTFFSILYSILFVFCAALLVYAVQDKYLSKHLSFFYLLPMLFLIAMLDYVSSYLYLFFTKNHKTIDLVQTAILSYGVVLAMIFWPSLFFILLGLKSTVSIIFSILVALFLFFYVLKELRILQILWIEKVDILSIHFFVYLCTFKFLPLIILVKVIF